MEQHRHLEIVGPKSSLIDLIEQMSSALPVGWTRDKAREAELAKSAGLHNDPMYCFISPDKPKGLSAAVWLAHRGDGELWVANIVPCTAREMSVKQCNAVIEDFHDHVLSPSAAARNLHVQFGPSSAGPEDWMTSPTAKQLRAFSGAANKNTSHPNDEARWIAFLISAHKENAELNSDALAAWLREEGWEDERAEELARDYDFARALLKAYDR